MLLKHPFRQVVCVEFQFEPTLEYRINGEGGENNQGGWKWFDITIIRGLE